jgi:hypothetical protein
MQGRYGGFLRPGRYPIFIQAKEYQKSSPSYQWPDDNTTMPRMRHAGFLKGVNKRYRPANCQVASIDIQLAYPLQMCSTVIERRHREEQHCYCNTSDGTTRTSQLSQLDSSYLAHFMKKIHLQVVRSAMIPPSRGPSKFAKANTELTMPTDWC